MGAGRCGEYPVDGSVDIRDKAYVLAVEQVNPDYFVVGVFCIGARPVAREITKAEYELPAIWHMNPILDSWRYTRQAAA